MATTEDEDETASLLNTLALEIGQSTGNTEGSDSNISARYSTFIVPTNDAARPREVLRTKLSLTSLNLCGHERYF